MAAPQPKENLKILIVENEVIIGEDLRARLESLGYTVLDVVGSGVEAIRTVDSERPDLVLMAITLKGEIDGIEAAEIVRTRFDIPVVFITAYADKDRLERAKPALPFGYVLKPFHEMELRVTVEMALFAARADSVRRDTEKALKEANERLSATLEALPDLMFEVDRAGRIFYYHATDEDLLYTPPDEFIHRTITEVLPADAAGIILSAIQETSRTGRHYGAVYSLSLPTGVHWYELSISAKGDRSRPDCRFIILARDITARVKAEEALRAGQERLSLVLKGTNDGVWDWDIGTNGVYYSPRWKELIGYEDHEIANRLDEWESRVHPDDLTGVLQAHLDHLENRTDRMEVQYRLRHKDGTYRWILGRGQCLRDGSGKPYRMVGSHTDITTFRTTLKALGESENRFRVLLDRSADCIFVHDMSRRLVLVNGWACKLLGYEREELIGTSMDDLVANNRNEEACKRRRMDVVSGQPVLFEAYLRKKDGSLVPVEIFLVKIELDGIPNILASVRDVTVRKKAKAAALVNQQRMEALVQLSRMDESSNDEVALFALEKSADLTGSKFGTFVILSEDESRTTHIYFTDEARRHCVTQDDALEASASEWGLWAEALRRREPFVMDDYSKDHPAKKGVPEGHVELNRLLAIPIIHDGRVVAVAVVANKKEPYSELDVLQFRLFMEGLWRIMERRLAREKIVTSLREKEILLREVHHRVKNNLQVVSSLLNLQANKERDARVIGAIEESQSRIAAMAMVHESVYQSQSLASINLKTYLEGLLRNLEITYSPTGGKMNFELSVRHNIELTMDRAAPCGLVMNELIVNAVKHAFPGNRAGRVVVEGALVDGPGIRLSVRDDGIGLPEDFDMNNVETLGLSLVKSLVEFQLLGSIEIRRGEGAEFSITFPV